MSVTPNEILVDLVGEDRLEPRRLKAEVEETRTGEKGEYGVLGRRWMGHGDLKKSQFRVESNRKPARSGGWECARLDDSDIQRKLETRLGGLAGGAHITLADIGR